MKFGVTDNIDNLDLSLPEDHPLTISYFKSLKPAGDPKIYFGGAKWGKKEWIGTVYPPGTKDLLSYYAKLFNTIELNATYHRFPPADWINKWKGQVPENFKFCPKVYQSISHRYQLKNVERLNNDFIVRVNEFGEQLGCIFLQLSDRFSPKKFDDLANYINNLPRDVPFAIELRHGGWFTDEQVVSETYHLFQENHIGFVITDAAGRRDVCHMLVSSPEVMVRFVGNGLHQSDYERINDWLVRAGNWFDQGMQEFYFLMHQPDEVSMVKALAYFTEKTNQKFNMNLKVPQLYQESQ